MEGPGASSTSGTLLPLGRFSEFSRVREGLRPWELAPPTAPTRGSLSSEAFLISSSSFFSRFLATARSFSGAGRKEGFGDSLAVNFVGRVEVVSLLGLHMHQPNALQNKNLCKNLANGAYATLDKRRQKKVYTIDF